jgi:hypothetical protein
MSGDFASVLPAIAALVFGIAVGWLIWGGWRNRAGAGSLREGDSPGDAATPQPDGHGVPFRNGMKLDAIEHEIKNARALLDDREEAAKAFADELTTVDAAIKRANGRLKLILRAVKKLSDRGP